MFRRLSALLLALTIVLGTFGSALAQDAPQVFCGDLADADCQILQQSREAMQNLAQYTANSTFVATLTGIPGLPANEVTVNVAVDGSFAMDEAARAASHALVTMDTAAQRKVLAESPQTVIDLVNGLDFDAVLSAEITPELATAWSAQTGVEIPTTLKLPVKLIDGVFYWDQTELVALFPQATPGWLGVNLTELVTELDKQGVFQAAAAQADPATLAQSGGGASLVAVGMVESILGNPELRQQFSSVTRGEDAGGAATFLTTFDFVKFFGSPEFAQAVTDLAQAGAFEGTGLTAADVEQNVGMLSSMAPMLFTGLTAKATQTIDLETNYQTDYTSELAWDLSSLVQMAAMSGQLPAGMQPTGDQVGFSIVTDIKYSDFAEQQDQTFEAPADAVMVAPLAAD